MDALSDVLRVVGLTGGVFVDAEFTDPWVVSGKVDPNSCKPFMALPAHVVSFHYVIEGGFDVCLEDGRRAHVGAGEVVMLPHNDEHTYGSALDRPPRRVDDLIEPSPDLGMRRISYGGGGAKTHLVCGFLGGGADMSLLLAGLPAMMVINVAEVRGGDWLSRSFTYAAQTMAEGDPGASTVMAKMSELLFVEAVRRHLADLSPEQTGWLAGLRDPVIGRALSLLHTRVAKHWTADALASEVNMSRSAFADRFTALVGAPPMRYLTSWRMQMAANKLRDTRQSIAQIAFDVGYESEAAFTRAFRREMGQPPAAWRRQVQSA